MRELFLVDPDPERAWEDQALCGQGTDPDLFFDSKRADEALEVCARCPVRVECLQYAVMHEEPFGVWGGVSAAQRGA